MKARMVLATAAVIAALALAGCGVLQQKTPQALPTVVLGGGSADSGSTTAGSGAASESSEVQSEAGSDRNSYSAPASSSAGKAGVVASGNITPKQEAALAFAIAARVKSVEVKTGDAVKTGQVLARLAGSERLEAAVETANLELLAAQKALADLNEAAASTLADTQLRLAKAKDALDQAEKRRGWKEYRVGNDEQINLARADLILAEDNLERVEGTYSSAASSENDDLNKAAAITAIAAARRIRDKALANLNYLLSMPDSLEVDKAEAELQVAKAEVEAARRKLEKWQAGPDPAEVSLVEARIQNAQAQVVSAQASLADLELLAPFDGVLIEVNIHNGEWALPGQPVIRIADLAHLQVKTTDLSERDVPYIQVGQPVTVLVEALGQSVPGKVSEIAPLAGALGGDVIYETTIDLTGEALQGLRAGMSVEVTFR